ncbi:dihydroorotate dehydrogenase [Thermotomaculum hydrothermale]|uniref:dihydroorotate dehydrogenase n=1 Tax=Thermotomaculum hydrothermale TaxID=981385 RepID=UPI0038B42C31
MELSVDLGRNLKLKNPVLLASGTCGYGLEFENFYPLSKIGGICTKGLSYKPIEGNPTPRIVETSCGMINSIGLQNIGAKAFVEEKLPLLAKKDTKIIVNIFGYSLEEYIKVVEFLSEYQEIDGFEVNISCPNVKKGGIQFGTNPKLTKTLVSKLRKTTEKHLMIKLSPNVTDITEFAKVCEGEGADSISLINTLLGMAVNIETKKFSIKRKMGGFSGPAIKPVALRMVYQCVKAVKIPVIGIGGISNYKDALEFLLIGAKAIQIGTANFFNPSCGKEIVEGISNFLQNKGIENINQWIGSIEDE